MKRSIHPSATKWNNANVVLLLLCFAVGSAESAGLTELRFINPVDLPNSGIKFKLMPGSAEIPLPPPATATYTRRDSTGLESREDRYSPYELWLHDQHAGIWADANRNSLALSIIRYPLPGGFDHQHVKREDYTAAADKLLSSHTAWSEASLQAWAGDYLKEPGITSTAIAKPPFKFETLVEFNLPKTERPRYAFAFKLNKSAAGQQMAPSNWFFVYIECNPGVDPARALKAVQNEFIGSIGVPPMSAEHKVAESREFQSNKGSLLPSSGVKSEEFEQSRSIVKQSIANLKDWWFVETDHFIILSNLSIRYKSTLADLQNNIQHLRYAYEMLMPPAKPITAVSVIRVPGTPEEYKSYVGAEYAWSGGLWMAARRELVIRAADSGTGKQQKEQMLSTTYHEGFHQYLFYALDQHPANVWFNEGHACFFESVTLNNTRFAINEDEYKAREADKMIAENAFNVTALVNMDYKTFYAGSDINRRNNYTGAWLLVYYLRKFAAFDPQSHYAGICDTYYSELIKTRDMSLANSKAFEGVDLKQLESDIIKFWKTRNMRIKAQYNLIFKNYKPGSKR